MAKLLTTAATPKPAAQAHYCSTSTPFRHVNCPNSTNRTGSGWQQSIACISIPVDLSTTAFKTVVSEQDIAVVLQRSTYIVA